MSTAITPAAMKIWPSSALWSSVIAQRDLVLAVRDRMLPLIAKGMTADQVVAAKLTGDTDASIPPRAETAEEFVRWLYAELTRSQQRQSCSASD